MKITELIIENTLVSELDLKGVGQALGTGAKKAANVAGVAAGGLRGLGTSFKRGYDIGKAYTGGTASTGTTVPQPNVTPSSGGAVNVGATGAAATSTSTPPAQAPAPRTQPTPPAATSSGPVPGQEIEMPGTNLKFKYDANWKDAAGDPADPAIQNVLQQLASGVDKASIPRADLNAARRRLGLPAFESKTVGYTSKFLGKTI